MSRPEPQRPDDLAQPVCRAHWQTWQILRLSFFCLLTVWSSPVAAQEPEAAVPPASTEQVEEDEAPLPKLEEMEVPSYEELLTGKPRDWVVFTNDDVLVVDTLVPRPNTIEAIQQKIAEKDQQRRQVQGEQRDQLTSEIQDLSYLYLTLPEEEASPEFRVPLRRVKSIIHHEDLVIRRINALLDERRIDAALELLTRLEKHWQDWPGMQSAGERILLVDAELRIDDQRPEAALVVLNELYRRNRNRPELFQLMGRATQMLVEDAISREDWLATQFFMNRLQSRYVNHPVYQQFQQDLTVRTQEMLQQGVSAMQQSRYRDAAVLAEAAVRIWPRTPNIQAPFKRIAERYQRLHVGVVDLPGECQAYPVPAAADLRQQRLMQLPLFEIDRVRDGTAYYRTRFFDEWEPQALGREIRFTLRQFRQPYEIQSTVSVAEVVTPILQRIDPDHPSYDERLAAFIASVRIHSPIEFSITFRRVPSRLEPLLSRIFLNEAEGGELGLAPLDDPGGFSLIEQNQQQVIYQRKLTEPEGLQRYHVAEIVEHRYPTYEKAVQALHRGEVSMLPEVPDWIARTLQNDDEFLKRYFILRYALPQSHLLQFNPSSPALRVRELRMALSYAIDREQLLGEIVLQDPLTTNGRLVTTPFLSSSPGRNVLVPQRRFDLSSALAMTLAAKNQLNNQIPPLTMIVAPGSIPEAVADRMASVWRKIGLEIRVVRAQDPAPEHWDILYRTQQMTEPLVEMWPFLTFQKRARIDDLEIYPDWLKQEMVELDRTSDQARAVESLQTLHRHLWESASYVPLWEFDQYIILRKNLQGFPQRMIHCYDRIDRWTLDAWYQTELP